ncbi:MAG TPA: SAM-dependent methyltransferase [Chitinophagaceae bacterium]|nr:SAM-dependent methyltransferase [Chitinophagaceae bacterium]
MANNNPILTSWHHNADNWIATIAHNEIASRTLVTNQAIIQATTAVVKQHVLDVGCGEGWLCRALQQLGLKTFGVDAVAALITHAQTFDQHYQVVSYEQLISGCTLAANNFDTIVINFALIDEHTTAALLPALQQYLPQGGYLVIQTLHPHAIDTEQPYKSGWRPGGWQGMARHFDLPYDWYCRTLADWIALFLQSGYHLVRMQEPLHPHTQRPASVIFTLQYTTK